MSKLTESFLAFLLEKHKQTGQNSFCYVEYKDFDGYERAIIDLSNRGIIEKKITTYLARSSSVRQKTGSHLTASVAAGAVNLFLPNRKKTCKTFLCRLPEKPP